MEWTLYVPHSLDSYDREIGHHFDDETTAVPHIGAEVCLMYRTRRRFFRIDRLRYAVPVHESVLTQIASVELWCTEVTITGESLTKEKDIRDAPDPGTSY